MNGHTGFHETKDGKRFNPECLACLAEDRNFKKHLFEKAPRKLEKRINEQNTNTLG